jgi:NAD(P)H-nitrite reductase large subunit
MRIDRCLCFDKSFAELKAISDTTGAETIEELQRQTKFGKSCRLCHPYVRRMLRTGETVFFEVIEGGEDRK